MNAKPRRYVSVMAVLLVACCEASETAALPLDDEMHPTPVLKTNTNSVIIEVGNERTDWTVSPDTELDVFSVVCETGNDTTVTYRSDVDSVTFRVRDLHRQELTIIGPEGIAARNELRCLPPPVRYDGSYLPTRTTAGLYPDDLDPLVATYFDFDRPGVLVGVWESGDAIYQTSIGVGNLAEGRSREVTDPFEIASLSKEFTAISIMQLVEAGKIELDAPISNTIPELPWADAVTVRHLLSHTSGLGNRTYTADYTVHSPFNAEMSLSRLAQANLAFEPGASYLYSNAGMTLLALIVERVSGESREDYIRRQILAPAGMAETQFLWNLSDDELNTYTVGYVQSGANVSRVPSRGHVTASFGSGDLVSTLGNLRKWHLALKGGSILAESSLVEMAKPVLLADGSWSERGLAFMIGEANGERFIYNSGDLYTHTRHAFFLDRDVSVIVNANVDIDGNFDVAGRVRDQIIAKLENTHQLDMYGETIDVRGDY